jgi:hypothetical protein
MPSPKYDAFEHLCCSLFSGRDDLFMMITGYFDDSQTAPDQKTPIVVGYLASQLQWQRFREQWAKLLERHDVPFHKTLGVRVPHRVELENLTEHFSHWDKARRDRFLQKAFPIIRKHTRTPIGHSVLRKDFEEAVPKPFQDGIGGPQGWCVYMLLWEVRRWCKLNKHNEPINFVCEQIHKKSASLIKEWYDVLYSDEANRREFRLGTLSFGDKRIMPLLAADFIAYDFGRYVLDDQLGRTRGDVYDCLDLLLRRPKPYDGRIIFWNAELIKSFFRDIEEIAKMPTLKRDGD